LSEIVKSEPEKSAAVERLSGEELEAYSQHVRSGKPELASQAAARLYGLYLQGVKCEDMVKLNPALTLGCIVQAKVRYNWDQRKDAYVADLMTTTGDIVRQTAAETVQLMGLMLAVASKRHGEKLKKYLASGNEAELGEFDIKTIKQLKDVVEMLVKITGADRKQEVKLTGTVVHEDGPVKAANSFTPDEADQIRKVLAARNR